MTDTKLIIDLGCNIGETMREFAEKYPEARIYGFELDSRTAAEARGNLSDLGNRIAVIDKAVGWPEREETAWIDIVSSVSSINPYQEERLNTSAFPTQVHVYSLDTVLEELGLENEIIDILKIDIEGEELNLLSGEGEWFRRTRMIYLECHRDEYMYLCSCSLMDENFSIASSSLNPCSGNVLVATNLVI